MVYLEKEIKQMNGEIDEFEYSDEYIDFLFDKRESRDKKALDEQLMNIDCLLGQ